MNQKLSPESPLKVSGGAPSAWRVLSIESPSSTEQAICSREDVSADLSARGAALCTCRHESALSICVKLLSTRDGPLQLTFSRISGLLMGAQE